MASPTIRRCTPNFFATPVMVPMPNSNSRRICSNNSTLALHSNELLSFGLRPNQSTRSFSRVDQNKMPNWAVSEHRNHHVRCTQFGPFWKRPASDRRHHLSGADYWIDITRADRPSAGAAQLVGDGKYCEGHQHEHYPVKNPIHCLSSSIPSIPTVFGTVIRDKNWST
jgi:hypothetical protein